MFLVFEPYPKDQPIKRNLMSKLTKNFNQTIYGHFLSLGWAYFLNLNNWIFLSQNHICTSCILFSLKYHLICLFLHFWRNVFEKRACVAFFSNLAFSIKSWIHETKRRVASRGSNLNQTHIPFAPKHEFSKRLHPYPFKRAYFRQKSKILFKWPIYVKILSNVSQFVFQMFFKAFGVKISICQTK